MTFFIVDELFILDSVKADTKVTGITYYKWNNLAVSKTGYVFIDKIELKFNNIPSILFEINDADDGISLKTHYNVANEIKEVESKFDSQIKITQSVEDKSKLWKTAIANTLISFEAEQEQNFHLNHSVLVNFGKEQRIIYFNPEKGMLVDIFENAVN
ncbi:MAG: hypothetical protein H0U95_13910 [Bacteroidetes bacterium]|nr:hypothetical protein [Bacteroidota bacterium]